MRNDDGRLQACGWSLPAKYKQVIGIEGGVQVQRGYGGGAMPGGTVYMRSQEGPHLLPDIGGSVTLRVF